MGKIAVYVSENREKSGTAKKRYEFDNLDELQEWWRNKCLKEVGFFLRRIYFLFEQTDENVEWPEETTFAAAGRTRSGCHFTSATQLEKRPKVRRIAVADFD